MSTHDKRMLPLEALMADFEVAVMKHARAEGNDLRPLYLEKEKCRQAVWSAIDTQSVTVSAGGLRPRPGEGTACELGAHQCKFPECACTESATLTRLERFGLAVLEEHRNEITDLDGGWIQDRAVELGLIAGVNVTEPCSEQWCKCAEYADFPQECLRETDEIREKMAAFRASTDSSVKP